MTCVFMRRRKFGLRHTQKQNNVDNVKIQRRQRPCEDEGRDWNYAVESHETPTVTRRWMKKGRILPWNFKKIMVWSTPWFWNSRLHTEKRIHFSGFKPLSLWYSYYSNLTKLKSLYGTTLAIWYSSFCAVSWEYIW